MLIFVNMFDICDRHHIFFWPFRHRCHRVEQQFALHVCFGTRTRKSWRSHRILGSSAVRTPAVQCVVWCIYSVMRFRLFPDGQGLKNRCMLLKTTFMCRLLVSGLSQSFSGFQTGFKFDKILLNCDPDCDDIKVDSSKIRCFSGFTALAESHESFCLVISILLLTLFV